MSIAKHRELLVLSAIESHETHGYALAEALEQGLGQALGLTRPNIYAILDRLDRRGWIRTRSAPGDAAPERRVRTITEAGRRARLDLLRACIEASDSSVLPLAVLLADLGALPGPERRRALVGLAQRRRRERERLDALPHHDGDAGAALMLVRRHLDVDLEAIDAALRSLDAED